MVEVQIKELRKIDYDRGVIIKQDTQTGIEVFMYKDEPGVYYDGHGRRVKESLAKRAGYPVDRYARIRQHKRKMQDVLDAMDDLEKLDLGVIKRAVLREVNGFKLVALPHNRAMIEDMEGKMVGKPSSRELIEEAFKALISDDFPEDDEVYATNDPAPPAPAKSGPKKVAP